ncbi:alpha-ketoglutarate-dependent taurine dioxygenase [Flavobacterium araucananum]|jgi:alpha-ketoglutarate-dependent taurine dioxygenase|uniref:TauD/TfdA-like domain-containing protein n=1 Tax=Flavobacterium araucananum TaxID=946678 RepID=A0A227PGX1_9FLAO|nr:TauD/TfdA family dioxygenase [Flavobacterium araucananum]OXG09140.1 hypothetical protein B0A64_03860 [Flavobacterium araucananum]PWJ99664.1 alpha-ketoglutarate-dependent taurine dioxygenase [Flavobacterium araucananum]
MIDRINKLKNQDHKRVNLEESVKATFFDNKTFPLVISSANSGYSLKNWLSENSKKFETDLLKYGSVLFRNFRINSIEKFQELMTIFPKELLEYKFRSSPRFELVENVYVSTTYPEDETINMHSENSYAANPPARIVFCCITAAEYRGETPIADNRLVLEYISEPLKKKFKEKGVLYRRNLNGVLGLSWQEVFQTSDKTIVQQECDSNGINYTWVKENELVLTWKKEAICQHPETNEWVWFNHSLFFNKYMLHEDFLNSIDSDDELPNNTFFGDGSEISRDEILELKAAYQKATIEFTWINGDVLFLDNLLFSHGRNPYKGDRKIIVSIL